MFLHVDATAVPQKQRAGFVALEVRRSAPFSDPRHDVAWFGDHAAVWYWSDERAHNLLGASQNGVRFRSEAVYRGGLNDLDGVELLQLELPPADGRADAGGVEARLWRRGHIQSSRWWSGAPSESDWRNFLRGGGLDPSTARPPITVTSIREQPLSGGFQPVALLGHLSSRLPLLATGAGALVLAALAWQVAGVARVSHEINRMEARLVPVEKKLETIIRARGRADAAWVAIDGLLALRPPASQTRMLAEARRITPGSDWQLMLWSQPGPDTLEVTLKGTNLDTAAIVTAWEQSPLFQNVSPTTGTAADELTLNATLEPLSGPKS